MPALTTPAPARAILTAPSSPGQIAIVALTLFSGSEHDHGELKGERDAALKQLSEPRVHAMTFDAPAMSRQNALYRKVRPRFVTFAKRHHGAADINLETRSKT